MSSQYKLDTPCSFPYFLVIQNRMSGWRFPPDFDLFDDPLFFESSENPLYGGGTFDLRTFISITIQEKDVDSSVKGEGIITYIGVNREVEAEKGRDGRSRTGKNVIP